MTTTFNNPLILHFQDLNFPGYMQTLYILIILIILIMSDLQPPRSSIGGKRRFFQNMFPCQRWKDKQMSREHSPILKTTINNNTKQHALYIIGHSLENYAMAFQITLHLKKNRNVAGLNSKVIGHWILNAIWEVVTTDTIRPSNTHTLDLISCVNQCLDSWCASNTYMHYGHMITYMTYHMIYIGCHKY